MSKICNRDVSKRLLKSSLKSYRRISKSNLHKKEFSEKFFMLNRNSVEPVVNENSSDTHQLIPITNFLKKLNFKYEVVPDSQIKQHCFYIQDKFMNSFFTHYPEYVCFDILCEIPELDQCLVLFIGLDSNGHCEIVSIGLIKSGNQQGFSWLCEAFKKHNPHWKKIEFILSDQSCDRENLMKAFPEKLIFISFFHCMKAFKKDISSLDPSVSNHDINKTLQLFEQMMFVTSESAYMELLKQMKQMHPQIFSLFKKNWHLKRELWALGLYSDSKIFLKAFNSYLLSIRKKIKPVVSTQETVENVIQKLHSAIVKLRKEWFQKFTCIFQSPSISYSKVRVMQKYSTYLTPFATELVNEQLNNSENMKNVHKIDHCTYKVNGTVVSFNTCCCSFHTLMMLPCCHIFAVRNFLSLPLFVDSLRSSWASEKYHNTFFDLYAVYAMDKSNGSNAAEKCKRFQQCIQTSHELWNLLLNCPENVSQERLEVFQNLLKTWKSNFKVSIKLCEKQNDSSNCNSETFENLPTDYFQKIYGISLNDILDSENEFSSVPLCSEGENELF